MRPISLRMYAPVCLLQPQNTQSAASFVHRGQDGVLSTTADLQAQGDRRAMKVSTKACRQAGRRRPSRPTSSKQCTKGTRTHALGPNAALHKVPHSDQTQALPGTQGRVTTRRPSKSGQSGVPQWGCVLYRRHAHHLIAHSSSPKTQIWEVPHLGRPSTTHLFGRE